MRKTTDATASSSLQKPPSPEAYLAWVVVCLVWGTTYLAIRVAIETIPPFVMAGTRWLAAGLVLGAVLRLRGTALPPRSRWAAHALYGILMIGFGNGAVVWAQQTVPSGLAALLVAVTPFWMMGIEHITGRGTPPTRRHIIGLLSGFLGVVLLVWPEVESRGGVAFLGGVLATQLATVGWALGSALSRRGLPGEHVLATSALQMIFGGAFLTGVALITREPLSFEMSRQSAFAVVYLFFVGSLLAYSAYAYALQHLPLSTVSLYAYVNPVIAVALGTIFLGEPLTWRLVAASAIVLGSVIAVRR